MFVSKKAFQAYSEKLEKFLEDLGDIVNAHSDDLEKMAATQADFLEKLTAALDAVEPVEAPVPLDEATIAQLKETPKCMHCGGWHARACPRVKSMTMQSGSLTSVEFWAQWPTEDIIWPDEVF